VPQTSCGSPAADDNAALSPRNGCSSYAENALGGNARHARSDYSKASMASLRCSERLVSIAYGNLLSPRIPIDRIHECRIGFTGVRKFGIHSPRNHGVHVLIGMQCGLQCVSQSLLFIPIPSREKL
jgi:hypothetical protein